MSADFSSSNPFRRKERDPLSVNAPPPHHSSLVNHIAYQQADSQRGHAGLDSINGNAPPLPKKIQKRVRVQSPPPPSPSIPDSASTTGDENYSVFARHLTPPLPRDDDPFEGVTSDFSEDEALSRPGRAPANPFSKTLETMEHPERERPVIPPTNVASPGRASMDVEAFKRLLMTGNSGLATPAAQPGSLAHGIQALAEGGTSTETSSVSRQSIFEAIQEPHPESPRTSHEISEPDDEIRRLSVEGTTSSGRKPPPPPSSRHGKMIKVELRDELSHTIPFIPIVQTPPSLGSPVSSSTRSTSYTDLNISQTDLNKPLPPAPNRTSHDSERESVFDKESLGKTPEPPSPSSSLRRKTPPAPPLSRRHSQMVSESKLNRSGSGRLSPKVEEDIPSIAIAESTRPRSDSNRLPPPPPTRRPASIRTPSQTNTPLTSPSTVSLPAPPPARGSSIRRPPSVHSVDMSSSSVVNKRASFMPPPPPPPHRHGRPSTDAQVQAQSPNPSRRTSGEQPRRSVDSVRRGSVASSVLVLPEELAPDRDRNVEYQNKAAGNETGASQAQSYDILADLTKLQRDIDALRVQSGKEGGKTSHDS